MNKKWNLLFYLWISLITALPVSGLAAEFKQDRILLLYSYHPTFPTSESSLKGFYSAFDDKNRPQIDIEYMESKRLPDPWSRQLFDQSFRNKISQRDRYDVIVAADDNAFNYLLENKGELFPGVPMVFWGVNDEDKGRQQDLNSTVTGVIEAASIRDTLDLIKDLLPEERKLSIIADDTVTTYKTLHLLDELNYIGLELDVWSLKYLTWQQLTQNLNHLSSNDAVLLISAYHDAANKKKTFEESLRMITRSTQASVFHLGSHGMGQGLIGGVLVDYFRQGQDAGSMARRILNGTPIASIPVVGKLSNTAMLDYQVLLDKRIPLNRVPEGVQLINRPKSGIEISDTTLILIFCSLAVLLMFLIQLIYLGLASRREKLNLEQAHALLQRAHSRLESLLSAMRSGILFESSDGVIEYVNPRFLGLLGIDLQTQLSRQPSLSVLDHSPFQKELSRSFPQPQERAQSSASSAANEVTLSDGRSLTVLSYPVVNSKQQSLGKLWVFEDISQEKRTAEQLIYFAQRDPLTGLYNRRYFLEQLERSCADATRRKEQLALLYIDLDNFKFINDTYGHRAGDECLTRVAEEIAALTRSGEVFARLGGDEFAVFARVDEPSHSSTLAKRVVEAIANIHLEFAAQQVAISCSVGVAHFPVQAGSVDELVVCADVAMYSAKHQGKNNWALYDPELNLHQNALHDLSWAKRINHALDSNGFVLHFQGVYHVKSGRLSHLEALIRMVDPLKPNEFIMPSQFISVAERMGSVVRIDRWVISSVIKVLAESPDFPDIAVNVSSRSFEDSDLSDFISEQLQRTGVAPSRIMFEFTETSSISELHDSTRLIHKLHDLQCQVFLDDYGSGFSSFSYLKKMDVDGLKIDGKFISNMSQDEANQLVVEAMVGVAGQMGKITVAEFVDEPETLEILARMGVDYAQGFLLDMPSAIHSLADLELKRLWRAERKEPNQTVLTQP